MAEPQLAAGSPSSPVAGLPVVLPISHDPNWIGPLLIGTLLQVGIFCILATQVVVYFARQGHGLKDGRLLRLYVAGVVLFTTLQVAAGVWRIYKICVALQPWALLPHPWIEVVLTGIVVESVHVYFIFRCYKLSRSKLLLGIILVLQLAQIVTVLVMIVCQTTAVQPKQFRNATIALDSASVALDAVISITLFVNLWRQRTGQDDVDAVILQIIGMTVQSFVPCVICLILVLISAVYFWTLPLGSLFPLAIPLASPLYANALLTTLNSRLELRRQLDSERNNHSPPVLDYMPSGGSNRSLRTSELVSYPLVHPERAASTSHRDGVACTNAIEPSNDGGSRSNQTASKSQPLYSDDDAQPDCHPEYPQMVSSTRARSSLGPQIQEQEKV